jgi:hypothetical protein
MRYYRGWRWRALLSVSLLLILLSGPRDIAVLVALFMPVLLPALLLFGIAYRLRKRGRR